MVEDLLDDMGRDAEAGHAGCRRASEVVETPISHSRLFVSLLLEFPEAGDRVSPVHRKDQLGPRVARQAVEDVKR